MKGTAPVTCPSPVLTARTPPAQPRSRGSLTLHASGATGRSRLTRLVQAGALKALFPRPTGPALDAVTINTGGGITGGDRFRIDVTATDDAHLRLTTQACERAYRAQPGEVGRMQTDLTVAAGARLDWLPQETILYDGCALNRALRIDLARDARLLMVEPIVFGRQAMGEVLRHVHVRDRIEIIREGAPLYTDAIRLWGDAVAHLARPAVAAGAGAMASLVFVAPEAEAHLAPLRALMPATGGVSLIGPDLLAMRLLAEDGHALRRVLLPVLNRLTENNLPRSWTT